MADTEIKIAHPFEKSSFVLANEIASEGYGKIVADKLEKGFGLTLGNALRRVLLTSLPGTAVYAVEVNGAVHEFSALDGIEEDLTEIILNLKNLKLKSDTIEDANYKIEVNLKGPATLKASMLKCPTGLEVVTLTKENDEEVEDPVICHVAAGGELNMVLYVRNGRGFATSEENKQFNLPVGAIATDSNYSPIDRVNYKVEGARVGHDSRYDKLTLEVWTNGTISPKDAVALSTKFLMYYFEKFLDLNNKYSELDLTKEEQVKEAPTHDNDSIEDLDLSVRSNNCLKRHGITTVGELIKLSESEMSKIRNLGKKSLKEIKDVIASKYNLKFRDDKGDN